MNLLMIICNSFLHLYHKQCLHITWVFCVIIVSLYRAVVKDTVEHRGGTILKLLNVDVCVV